MLNSATASDGSSKGYEPNTPISNQPREFVMARVQILEHTIRQPGGPEGLGIMLGHARRLLRHFENHAVARDDRRNHRVHRGQVWIVPGCHHEDDAERFVANEAAETVLLLHQDVGECVRRDVHHVAGPFLETSPDFEGTLRHRPADLPRQLGTHRIGALDHQVGHAPADRRALRQRHALPRVLPADGSLDGRLDLRARRQIELRVDGPVHRADDALARAGDRFAFRVGPCSSVAHSGVT